MCLFVCNRHKNLCDNWVRDARDGEYAQADIWALYWLRAEESILWSGNANSMWIVGFEPCSIGSQGWESKSDRPMNKAWTGKPWGFWWLEGTGFDFCTISVLQYMSAFNQSIVSNNLSSCLVRFLTLDAPTCYTDNAILAPEQWGTQANYHAARP